MSQLDALLAPGPTRVLAILNVTEDSFADRVHFHPAEAIEAGMAMALEGADLIDVGGESTRPGAARISSADELARVLPVVAGLAGVGLAVSVDTVRSVVAQAAIEAGAIIINDVSGGLADPDILEVVARAGVGYVVQHWRTPFDHAPTHTDVLEEVPGELKARLDQAIQAGVAPKRLICDPGIGFGKTADQNWELVGHPQCIARLGYPVVWGFSRKRFLDEVVGPDSEPWERDAAGVALTTWLATHSVWAVRTHTVTDHLTAIRVAEALRARSS